MAIPAEKMTLPNNTVNLVVSNDVPNDITGAELSLELAKAYQITGPEMLQAASDELKAVKSKYKELDAKRKSLTQPLDTLKKEWMDFFRPALDALQNAERVLKSEIDRYINEQEQKRLAAEAEAARLAREEQERLANEAAELEQAGKKEEAEEVLNQAAFVQTPVIHTEAPKVQGISQTITYEAVLIDKMALIKAVAAGEVDPDVLLVDMKALNKRAKAMKEHLKIPGVESKKKTGISARA